MTNTPNAYDLVCAAKIMRERVTEYGDFAGERVDEMEDGPEKSATRALVAAQMGAADTIAAAIFDAAAAIVKALDDIDDSVKMTG